MTRHPSVLTALTLCLPLGLVAADARADAPATQPAADAEPQARVGYLGVVVDRAAARFADPAGDLPAGVGLTVSGVAAGSPADAAGLRAGDVLHKLDDQLLVNAEQLAVLVRMRAPGDAVTLHLLRRGEAKQVKVQLGEASAVPGVGEAAPPEWHRLNLGDLMRDRDDAQREIDEAMKAVEQAVRELKLRVQPLEDGGAGLRLVVPDDPRVRQMLEDARARQRQMLQQLRLRAGPIPPRGGAQGVATATMNDGEHKITVTARRENGEVTRVVEVYNADGELLWEGRPDDDMADLPADVRKKVRGVLERMHLDPGPGAPPSVDADGGLRLD